MPQALLLVVGDVAADAAADAGISAGIAGAIGYAAAGAVAIGGLMAVSAIEAALAPTPKPVALGFPLKQSTPPRRSGYGRTRLSGAYMLYSDSKSDGTGTSQDILAIHDGQIDGFETFYLNDDIVSVRADGWIHALSHADGRYSNYDKLQVLTRLGLPTETAFTSVGGDPITQWDASHRGDGIAQLAIGCRTPLLKDYNTIYPNGLPTPSVVARLLPVADPTSPTAPPAWTTNPVRHLQDYLTNAAFGLGLNYAARIEPVLAYWQTAVQDCDVPMPVLNQGGKLLNDCGESISTIGLTCTTGLVAGTPLLMGDSAATIETVTVASVSGSEVGLQAPLRYSHFADEFVSWILPATAPAMLPRFEAGGAFEHTAPPSDTISAILASFDGWLGARGDGALVVRSGRYYPPVVTLDEASITGYSVSYGVEAESCTNVLVVQYTDPNHDYTTVEADPWSDTDSIATLGVERQNLLALDWVQRHDQARRLAKRQMSRNVAPCRGSVTTNLAGMAVLGERYVQLAIPELALNIPVEITRGEIDLANLALTFDWVAADPNIDQWNPAIEEGTPPVPKGRTAAPALAAPMIVSAVPNYQPVTGGTGGVRLAVTIAGLGRSDATIGLRWKLADGFYSEQSFSDQDATNAITLPTGFVPASSTVYVEAIYALGDGRTSPWSDPPLAVDTTVSATTHPLLAAPANVAASGTAYDGTVTFDPIAGAAGYFVAYSNQAIWDASTYGSIVTAGASPAYVHGLPAGTYYVKVFAFDLWQQDVANLAASAVASFTIATGAGPTPSGGGGGATGGGGRGGGVGGRFNAL